MRSLLLKWIERIQVQEQRYVGILAFFVLTVNLLAAASFRFTPLLLLWLLVQALVCLLVAIWIRQLRLTQRQEEEKSKQLAYLAYHDTLTGLPNRRLFDDRLKRALLHAQRNEELAAVVFLDMDRFKEVNDSLGHAYGDRLIRQAADRLLGCLRGSDTVYRQGGDEFIILLEAFAKPEDVRVVASRIQAVLDEPFILDGKPVIITASMGIALYPLDGTQPEQLLQYADDAMYTAKSLGNNRFQFYASEIDVMVKSKAHMESELRTALERQQFELLYQPQYEIASRRLIGMEVILHWDQAGKRLSSPVDWRKAAEELGLMVPIGTWAIRTACRQLQAWQDAGHKPLRMTMPITASQFKDAGFTMEVAQLLQETGIDPGLVELDLTESITSSNVQEASEKLILLKRLGVRIAMDDLSTGLLTRSGMEGLPFDSVKLDSTLIRDLVEDDENKQLAVAITRMAERLGLKLIAKGVETEEQLEYLKFLRCSEVQGQLFNPPLSPRDFLRLMAD
ncbi:EAL domain-containing protein [Bacillus sp. 3255]|uniref:putative bifunctional diguanylate cyclase/phosphodiesterase n=1 Tax=Bacillus sp. 3255 TaxID=2817904 RepID=UPI00285A23AC|nr:EAL domain-containing protein [Bacillus sp. 3255]MDR6884706.1 diguanylate cyclase (GGDEF)-like protein [Bacillus sp. 3255]